MAQSEGEAPEEKFQTQVPRQGLQAVVYSRMKSLPASAQGAVLSRLPSLPSASGIGHGRLCELLEEQLRKPKERVTREESRAYGKSLRNRVRIGSVRLTRRQCLAKLQLPPEYT